MTPLSKPVRRIVRDREGNFLVATLEPHGLTMRTKGQRVAYPAIPYGQLLLIAARLHVANEKAEQRQRAKR